MPPTHPTPGFLRAVSSVDAPGPSGWKCTVKPDAENRNSPRAHPAPQRPTRLAAKLAANWTETRGYRRTPPDADRPLTCGYALQWIPTDTACRA
jgi:hypothetical protein